MGSVRKVFKKVTKAVKKPVSKITKGIAKGIAKVGKAVIRGVAKINKKLGPLGTIALSMAMPYALSPRDTGSPERSAIVSPNALREKLDSFNCSASTGALN